MLPISMLLFVLRKTWHWIFYWAWTLNQIQAHQIQHLGLNTLKLRFYHWKPWFTFDSAIYITNLNPNTSDGRRLQFSSVRVLFPISSVWYSVFSSFLFCYFTRTPVLFPISSVRFWFFFSLSLFNSYYFLFVI